MEEHLLSRLEALRQSDMLPMHMPGHKRNLLAPYLRALGADLDITEIDGFDNLHAPSGILQQAQARAARLWGAEESYFLVGGSSAGILAGLYAAANRGEEVLIARNAHKSVFHALELCGFRPHFFLPPQIPGTGLFGSVTQAQAQALLDSHPQARLLLLTSPTYEGVISDIAGIAQVCHQHDVTLLVDEAHGAHLGLGGGFPGGAVQGGADLVVQSLHKTLPSLTQTAILHRSGSRVSPQRLRHALAVFQTSSPSYLLMASMDSCVALLEERPELLSAWRAHLRAFDQETRSLSHLQLLFRDRLPPQVVAYDPGKLLLRAGCPGWELSSLLRQQAHIELEMADQRYALAMTGLGDTDATLHRLAQALQALDPALPPWEDSPPETALTLPEPVLLPGEALQSPIEFVPQQAAIGRVSGEYVWAYPPGIPLLIPGERIHAPLPPVPLHSTYGKIPGEIAVVCQKSILDSPEFFSYTVNENLG